VLSRAPAALTEICRDRHDARVLVVDAGSPRRVSSALQRLAAAHDVAVLRVDRYLSPNEARNLAMRYVTTPLAAFVDTDARVAPGWLAALERCVEETGAAVVAPLTVQAEHGRSYVHQMGGDAHTEEVDGRRVLRSSRWHGDERPDDVRSEVRTPTEEAEFHCMIVDCAWFRRVGGLDEELLSLYEHTDFCMRVREAGGAIWFEPRAVASFGRPPLLRRGDRAYSVLRWSEHWNERSRDRFVAAWQLGGDPYQGIRDWARQRRRYAYRPYTTPFNRLGRVGRPVVDLVDELAQRRVLRHWRRSLDEAAPPHFTHLASWQRGVEPGPASR
jgi:hypothetical protein